MIVIVGAVLICFFHAAPVVLKVLKLLQLFDADICFCFLIKEKHDCNGDS